MGGADGSDRGKGVIVGWEPSGVFAWFPLGFCRGMGGNWGGRDRCRVNSASGQDN